ncbi:MAG: hypothetical protein CUR34_09465 [Sediminibacterium sp.]|nr:MAG: hypothetical protein CUR34_09465 [Sediminibacterium sp.] [Sediminibacterium sp. FEMGT703S]
MQPTKITIVEVMQKADIIPSDGTAADSGQKVEDIFVSQHSSKPDVVGSQISVTPENVETVCNGLSPILNQLNSFLSNHNLTKKDISFSWRGDKVAPFIRCG